MKLPALCCLLAVCVACSGGTAKPAAVASAPAVPTSCSGSVNRTGTVPGWVDAAGGHNNPIGVPFTSDQAQTVAGFVFGYPLRAGHPENPANKILWVVRLPRGGSDLTITGHPLGATTPVINVVQPADSGPGEIYPSIVDMPTAGCWVLDLGWASHHSSLALPYSWKGLELGDLVRTLHTDRFRTRLQRLRLSLSAGGCEATRVLLEKRSQPRVIALAESLAHETEVMLNQRSDVAAAVFGSPSAACSPKAAEGDR